MSKSTPAVTLAILLVCLLAPAETAAQESAEIAAQRARIDSLLPEWRAANREILRADSIRRARREQRQVPVDTVAIAPFVIIAPRKQSAAHFRNFRRAVAERAVMLEGIPENKHLKLFVENDGGGPESIRYQAERSHGRFVRIFGNSPRVRQRFTRVEVDNALYEYLPPAVQAWLGGTELGRGRNRAEVYRELATSPSPTVRECHKGSTAACISALGIGSAPPDSGFSSTARGSFLMHALASGGAGSLARLNDAGNASAGVAIEQASGRQLPRLVNDWKRGLAREYVSYAGLVRASGAGLLWAVIAGLLALRSTRRRAE
jgi:hypothetical protein